MGEESSISRLFFLICFILLKVASAQYSHWAPWSWESSSEYGHSGTHNTDHYYLYPYVQPEDYDNIHDGELRLWSYLNYSYYEGYVVIYHEGEWKLICDKDWSFQEAHLVCLQMGLGKALLTERDPDVTQWDTAIPDYPYAFGDVSCDGRPGQTLNTCDKKDWAEGQTCHKPVAVTCEGRISDVRLVGGDTPNEGRVEVKVNSSSDWSTVCDDNWDLTQADVICRHLGYSHVIAYTPMNYDGGNYNHHYYDTLSEIVWFGEGTGDIYHLNCYLWEFDLNECHIERTDECTHTEDVSVRCAEENDGYVKTDVRLVNKPGSTYPYAGRVEVLSPKGIWGTVCDDSWDWQDAQVICRQLGFGTVLEPNAYIGDYGEGVGPIILDEVECGGYEGSIGECFHSGWDYHECSHSEDVAIKCTGPHGWLPSSFPPTKNPYYQDIRLSGATDGITPKTPAGRVELLVNNTWGTICNSKWTLTEADVVCREFGYPGAASTGFAHIDKSYPSTAPIHYSHITCAGYETHLKQCFFDPVAVTTCTHDNDALVACLPHDSTLQVRLVGGTTDSEGHVQIYEAGVWGFICDDNWDQYDALLVCRQLGYASAEKVTSNSYFGESGGTILASNVHCFGWETQLSQCSLEWYPGNCLPYEFAGVICSNKQKGHHDSLTVGATAGIAVGVFFVFFLILVGTVVGVVVCFRPCKRTPSDAMASPQPAVAFFHAGATGPAGTNGAPGVNVPSPGNEGPPTAPRPGQNHYHGSQDPPPYFADGGATGQTNEGYEDVEKKKYPVDMLENDSYEPVDM